MTTPTTGTLTRTASVTLTDARHVLWRIATDLRALRLHHGLITTAYEEEVTYDLLQFIYRGLVDEIEFRFVAVGSNTRTYAVRYAMTRDWSGDDDDDAGGLRYLDLTGTSFQLTVTYSSTWRALPADAQTVFRRGLKRSWGPVNDVHDGVGAWVTDRTYGSGGLGATRSVFRPA